MDSELAQLLKALVDNQNQTSLRIEQLLKDKPSTAEVRSTSSMARPEPFKSGSNDARHFIHFFTLWARSKGAPLNKDGAHDHKQWIIHALALLQGEALVWAVPFIQAIESNTTTMAAATAVAPGGVPVAITPFPFSENWETFVTEFKTRFQAADDQQ